MEGFHCTHLAILTDVPLQLWEVITTDGTTTTPIWVTRLFHNKPLFFTINYFKCYFNYLSPHFLNQVKGPWITILILAAVLAVWLRGGKLWKAAKFVIILYPLFFLFELQRYF